MPKKQKHERGYNKIHIIGTYVEQLDDTTFIFEYEDKYGSFLMNVEYENKTDNEIEYVEERPYMIVGALIPLSKIDNKIIAYSIAELNNMEDGDSESDEEYTDDKEIKELVSDVPY